MFETLFTFVESVAINNIASKVGLFTRAITPLLGACVSLYIVYVAWEIMFNRHKVVAPEIIKTIAALSAVTGIALNTPWYMNHVVPTVLTTGDGITQVLMGSGSSSGASLQNVFDQIWSDIASVSQQFVWELDLEVIATDLAIACMIIITLLGFIPFIAIATAYLLMAKIMVSFLLIIGPLFIMFAFFPSTRSFFQSWTGQCFNYVLLSILFPLSFSMITALLKKTVFSGDITFLNVLFSAVVFFALCIIATQIPTLSSTLSGGIGISGLIGNAVQGAKSAYKGAKNAKGAGKLLKQGVEKVSQIRKNKISGG